jgi:hypothetical protein
MKMTDDRISFQAPLDGAFRPVVRLVVGGVAERANFGFEAMDDLQLAIERLLVEAGSDGEVQLSFELRDGGIRTRVGPLHEKGLAKALQDPDKQPGSLSLARILSTVVDSYGVEEVSGGDIVVRLEKLGGGGR